MERSLKVLANTNRRLDMIRQKSVGHQLIHGLLMLRHTLLVFVLFSSVSLHELKAQEIDVQFSLKKKSIELLLYNRSMDEITLPSELYSESLPNQLLLISGDTIILKFENIKAEIDIYGGEILNEDEVYYIGPKVLPKHGLFFRIQVTGTLSQTISDKLCESLASR